MTGGTTIGRSDMEYMDVFLDRFESSFGTAEAYLQKIGLTPWENRSTLFKTDG